MAFGISDAVAAGLKVIDKFVPDPAAKAAAEEALRKDLLAADTQQSDVNAVEAAHPNIFVAGWRPAIGWACATSFAFNYVIAPVATWAGSFFGTVPPMPTFSENALMSMTYALLGLGGLRTYEKIKGVTK